MSFGNIEWGLDLLNEVLGDAYLLTTGTVL